MCPTVMLSQCISSLQYFSTHVARKCQIKVDFSVPLDFVLLKHPLATLMANINTRIFHSPYHRLQGQVEV